MCTDSQTVARCVTTDNEATQTEDAREPSRASLQTLTAEELARLCATETMLYVQGKPCMEFYAVELFRRAIAQQDDAAWAEIYVLYADLVQRWLGTGLDDVGEGIARTFERFWHAMDATKFERFGSLASVLQYLKLCAHAVRLDDARAAHLRASIKPLDDAQLVLAARDNVEEAVVSRLDAAAIWHTIQTSVPDEDEQEVLYLSYVAALSPRAIQALYPRRFPTVADVYRLKRRALDRLRSLSARLGHAVAG